MAKIIENTNNGLGVSIANSSPKITHNPNVAII